MELSARAGLADALGDWFAEHGRALPWREPGFTPWGSLVSEVMLQQTQVSRVVPVLAQWLARWPTPADLASTEPAEAVRAWGRLGYPRRALRLHAAATAITERHGGAVPADLDELLALPGVGDYTARAVAVFAYGRRHPVVDTNIRRVIARAVDGQAEAGPPSTRRDLAAMEALLPADDAAAAQFNAAVMELGAIVCTARSPRCEACPIAGPCRWRELGYPPYDGPRAAVQPRFEGSDREARGLIMALLRAGEVPVTAAELAAAVPDAARRERALGTLIGDGLAAGSPASGYTLP